MKKKLSILGSTGSIGISTLEVVRQFPDRFEVTALAAGRNVDLLSDQIQEFRPRIVAVMDEDLADKLQTSMRQGAFMPEIVFGADGYQRVATVDEANVVVSAMVGAAGLLPTLSSIEAGKTIALANKETLVIAGELVMDLAAKRKVRILPVDSEHSAIFQALQGNHRRDLHRILITASGGPFRNKTTEELTAISPDAALCHPNWSMGRKITIDSATLMNKGLEVIEAQWLFNLPVDQVSVHIHPESIVHSMVEYIDGSVIAQLGIPDMKIPIAYALSYPDRLPVQGPRLDLFSIGHLSFFPPDTETFPCLSLAYEAARKGGTMPAVLNAANEVAVNAFLSNRLSFLGIAELIRTVMDIHSPAGELTLQAILNADAWARQQAEKFIADRINPSKTGNF